VTDTQRDNRIEMALAVVLAAASVMSAWSAYQSILWGGVQTFRLASRTAASRRASDLMTTANQYRAFDASMLLEYTKAQAKGEKEYAEFLYKRFRPEMRKAFDAWLRTDPFRNPAAPPHPFSMAEYAQREADEARRKEEESARYLAEAEQANEISDRYVLFTVMLSIILFFGGIGGTFRPGRLRLTMGGIAAVFFIATMILLTRMPICRE
jgi:hypothetical protein